MRKFFTGIATGKPLLIKSVVANPAPRSVKGRSYVYIEAFKLAHVQEAIKGIENLRYGQWKQDMVSIEDRPNVLRVVKPSRPLKVGDWVQLLRSGDYKGDVARVEDVHESEGKVVVQVRETTSDHHITHTHCWLPNFLLCVCVFSCIGTFVWLHSIVGRVVCSRGVEITVNCGFLWC